MPVEDGEGKLRVVLTPDPYDKLVCLHVRAVLQQLRPVTVGFERELHWETVCGQIVSREHFINGHVFLSWLKLQLVSYAVAEGLLK